VGYNGDQDKRSEKNWRTRTVIMTDQPTQQKSEERPDNTPKFRPRPDKRDLLKRQQPQGTKPPSNSKNQKNGWPLGHRIAFVLLLFILGLFLWKQMNPENSNYIKVSYSKFSELLASDNIKSVRVRTNTLYGQLKTPVQTGSGELVQTTDHITVILGNYDQTLLDAMVAKGIDVSIEPERTWIGVLISTLPWIIILVAYIFILRQMQGGPKGVFTFGKSKAKMMAENQTKVTFQDVAGVEEAKVELQEVIEFLKDPGKFQRLGGKIPKGALLIGPPGTGKTLLARAVAGEAGVPFFSMSGSDFVEMFVGVGASRVRDLFEQGKNNAPCIIFIDEIDAVGRQRGTGIGGGHDEREQTLNQLLVEMDGFETNEGVILLAATNRPDVLDPALLRPGRFDRQIVVDWPDVKAREQILQVHVNKIKVDRGIDMGNIAKGTPGMTGADLANVVNEAALLAARLNRKRVIMADFEEAKDKVMMGTARRTLVITEQEKKLTACHEAGHVLVSKFIPGSDPVHKVSIIARGRALGLTHFLPSDEKHNWSYNYCLTKLAVLLGGRAAEQIKFNDVTNGAANDIENATKLARKMVCEWGMSKRLGPLTFGKKESEIFLGREIATHKDYSEETAIAIDQEVRKLVENAQQLAEAIVQEHLEKLDALTDELLRREILSDYQIEKIMNLRGRGHQTQQTKKVLSQPTAELVESSPAQENPAHGQGRKRPSRRRRRKPSENKTLSDAGAVTKDIHTTENADLHESPSSMNSSTKQAVSHGSEENVSNHAESKLPRNTQNNNHHTQNTKKESGEDRQTTDHNKSVDDDHNDAAKTSHSRRSRMIRLKIGGRRRTIKKAPAQKIRQIN
jgi:cell division protease FtsH